LKIKGISSISLGYDASLFTGPIMGPAWKQLYFNEGDVAPVSALEVDEGSPDLTKPQRAADPASAAASEFASLLSAAGVKVTGTPDATEAKSDDEMLASVQSPRVSALVQRMLGRSDNDLAEAFARQVAIASGKPATFAGGADAVRAAVAGLGVPASGLAMVDGSGLSPSDRVQPRALVRMVDLVLGGKHPELAPIAQALPVAGFSGTLTSRYTAPPASSAAGRVHAKTGTLDGVAALAGYLDDASGRVLAFAVIANGVPLNATARTEAAIDRLAAGLASCGCS
jgi:D-alanyl-D-alanine carboxypeptidase/D-alanyl-D-alanine-endopeptidase (penicillin-binding protein 4)